VDKKQKLEECRRILSEGGGIQDYAQSTEAPQSGMQSPAELAAKRDHVAARMKKIGEMVSRAIYVGEMGEGRGTSREEWERSGKPALATIESIESLVDQVEQALRNA